MKREKYILYSFIILLIITSVGIAISYFYESVLFLIISIILLVVSVLGILILQSISIFVKDKVLDIQQLKDSGLTIVECENCRRANVLEDKYCIYCGEVLGEENERI